jgi:hypothetical protein
MRNGLCRLIREGNEGELPDPILGLVIILECLAYLCYVVVIRSCSFLFSSVSFGLASVAQKFITYKGGVFDLNRLHVDPINVIRVDTLSSSACTAIGDLSELNFEGDAYASNCVFSFRSFRKQICSYVLTNYHFLVRVVRLHVICFRVVQNGLHVVVLSLILSGSGGVSFQCRQSNLVLQTSAFLFLYCSSCFL